MAQVDILVFGASGFTGEYICRELASQYSQEFTYGLAGRSQAKLEKVQNDIKNRGLAPPSKIVVADVKNEASLLDMAKSCRLLINAVGPYRFFGLQVVEACIKGGCHYVDISGEPWFLESSEFKFNELAKKNKVYSISACGFDSIPSDLGVEFTRREFSKIAEDGDQVNEIQAYLS